LVSAQCEKGFCAASELKRVLGVQGKRIIIKAIKVCVSTGLIIVVLRMANLEKVWFSLVNMNIYLFILANLMNFGRVYISAYRWKILLEVKGIRLSTNRLSNIYFIGIFFNMFLPTALGGDTARIFYLWRISGEKLEAMTSVVIERVIGFYALILICLFSILLSFKDLALLEQRGIILVICLLYLGGVVAVLNSRFMRGFLAVVSLLPWKGIVSRVASFYNSLHDYLEDKKVVIKSLILSIIYQLAWIVGVMMIGIGSGMDVSPFGYFVFLPVVMLVTMLPVSISGIGVREAAFVLLFGLGGVPASAAVLLSFLTFSMAIILGSFGGIIYALKDASVKKPDTGRSQTS
jgi:uncharacterized protein (TIRG00374 family)